MELELSLGKALSNWGKKRLLLWCCTYFTEGCMNSTRQIRGFKERWISGRTG